MVAIFTHQLKSMSRVTVFVVRHEREDEAFVYNQKVIWVIENHFQPGYGVRKDSCA